VSTSHADKLRLAFSVSLVDASALATGARSVPCVNELDRDTGTLGLVQDKLLQLAKRPTVQTTALLFISPYPTAYAFEILKRDTAFGALSSTHYLLGNLMVHITREPLFFSPAPAHQALGGLCALLLKLSPQAMVTAYEWNLLATVKRPNVRAALVHLPRQDARIVTDRAVLTKFPLRLLVTLVSVSHLGIQPDTWADNGNSSRIVR
jgi:hypothetical protein